MLWSLAALACLGALQDADRPTDDALDVPQLFVPAEQADKFRDPDATYQTMRYDAFLELLRAADAAFNARRFVGPTAGSIFGRVDVDGRRVVGTSTWSFSKGHGGAVEMRPWNLRVLSVRERGRSARPDWGLTAEGALVVRGLSAEARQVDVDWELPGDAPDRRWTISGQTPRCASSRIQFDYPAGWDAWAPGGFSAAAPSPDVRRLESRASGDANWSAEFVPAGVLDSERPLISWRGESQFHFGPVRTDVELRAILQIDREGAPNVRLRLPATLHRLSLATVGAAANWRRENLADGGVEWTAEFRRPPLGTVQLVASGSLPTPAGKPWPLEALAVSGALFRGERVEIVADPALRLLDLDAAGLARRDFRLEAGAARWQLVGFAKEQARPTIHFDVRRTEVETQTQHFLDVGRDRVRFAARVDWTCDRGELAAPTLLVPLGWTVQKTTVEPADRLRAAPAPEATEGATRVALPLTRPLTTGERLRATIQLERAAAGWTPASGATVPLPEVVAPDAVPFGPSTYSVRIDPALPFRLAGDDPQWTVAPSVAGAPPSAWNWDGEAMRFRFLPPLTSAQLRGVESHRLAFDADVLHLLRPRRGGWDVRTTFSVTMRSGEVGWVDIEALQPLPPDARWNWGGGEDARDDVQAFPAPAHPEWTRYRLPLRGAADGRTVVQTTWRTHNASVEPHVFRFPEADRISIRATVLSPDPERLEVVARGWVETPGDRLSSDAFDAREVRWTGRLDRAEGTALLRIRRAEPSVGERGGVVTGTVSVSGPARRRIFRTAFDLESQDASPFLLAVPAGAKLWSASFDGQPIAAWLHTSEQVQIVLSEPVPAGRHRLDLVFDAPTRTEDEPRTPQVLPPWRAGRLLWMIDVGDVTWEGRRDPRLLGALVWRAAGSATLDEQAERVARGRGESAGFDARRTARLLRTPPESLGLDQAEDVADALLALERRLPEGWAVVVERGAADAARAAREPRSPPRTVENWLTSIGLHPTIGDRVLLLTGRPLAAALDADGARLDPGAFAEAKAATLHATGVEPWGAFTSAAQWRTAGAALDRVGPWSVEDTGTTTLYVAGDGKPFDHFPAGAEARGAATLLGLTAGVVLALVALALRRTAFGVGGAAAAYLFAALMPSAIAAAAIAFAWGALGASLLAMLAAFLNRYRASAAALTLLVVASISRGGDEPSVLVPYDPARLDAPLAAAEVPEPLLRRLRSLAEGNKAPFLISSADYQGTLAGDQVEWRATLHLVVLAKEPPVKAAIGFIGVEVQSVEADGKQVGFLPPAASLPLVVTLSAAPKQTLTLRFRTPIAAAELGSLVEFPLPAAAQQSFSLTGFATPVEIVRAPESRGFSVRQDDQGVRIVGARGPSPLLQLLWRERTAALPLANVLTAVSLKPEGKSGAWELQSYFRWEAAGAVRELVMPIPNNVAVRRLEGPGLVGWTTATNAAGVRQLRATVRPGSGGGTLAVNAWFVPEAAKTISPPFLFPEGTTVRGVAIVTLPEGGLELAPGRGVAELPGAALADEWRRVTDHDPPSGSVRAFAISDQNHALALLSRPPPEAWRMSQELSIRAAPHQRSAAWSALLRFIATDPTDVALLTVPAGFNVERVETDALFQWFRTGDRLLIRFSKPMSGAWTVQASGSLAFPDGDVKRALLAPFLPAAGATGTCTWSLGGEGGVGVELADEPPPSCRVQHSANELRVEGPAEAAVLRVQLSRAAPKVMVRQGVLVRRRGGAWTCQGLVEINDEGARGAPWEVLTPKALGAIDWSAPGLRVLDAGARETFRRWLVEPRTAQAGDRFTLGWAAAPAASDEGADRVLDAPFARFSGAAGRELWVAEFAGEGIETTADGFTSEPVPEWIQAMAASFGGEQNLKVWRTKAASPQITLTAPKEAAPTTRPKVSGWIDASVAKSGRVRGRAVWWVADADERLAVALPSGCEALALRIDGRTAAVVPAGNGLLPVRIDPRARRSQVELEWSAPNATLPAFRDAEVGPTLVRLRSPYGFEASPATVDRAEWLARLLERECDMWLARANGRGEIPEDRVGLAFLFLVAKEAAAADAIRIEQVWGEFLEKASAAVGTDAASRFSNFSTAAGDFNGPRLDPSDADAVIDHFDFPGAPELPSALDSARPEPSKRLRPLGPWLFAAALAAAVALVYVGRRQ